MFGLLRDAGLRGALRAGAAPAGPARHRRPPGRGAVIGHGPADARPDRRPQPTATTCRRRSASTPTASRCRRRPATTEPIPSASMSAASVGVEPKSEPIADDARQAAAPGRSTAAPPRRPARTPSAGDPSRTTRPARMTTTRSNDSATNRMSWLMAMTVRSSAGSRLHDGTHPLDATGILPGRRLVEHEHRRPHGQDRRERQQLAARAAEVVRVRLLLADQAGRLERRRRAPMPAPPRTARGCAARTRPRRAPSRRRSGDPGPGRRARRGRRAARP